MLLVGALFVGLAVASPVRVARAQDPAASALADCSKDFSAQVAEAIWLRDTDPQSDAARKPTVVPGKGSELDTRTRFSLAVVIGDLLMLREQGDMESWPGGLRRLSSQELRQRRDAPAVDPIACEIVQFMREYYRAERDGTPLAKRTVAPASAEAQRPRAVDPAPIPATRPLARIAATATTPTSVAPAAAPPPVPRTPEKPLAVAPEPPRAPTPERPRVVVDAATVPDEEMPAPPPALSPPEAIPVPLDPIESAAVAVVEVPVEPVAPALPSPPAQTASAKADLAALEAQLSAPRYLTLRARRNGPSLPDDEVRGRRRQTLDARAETVRILKQMAATPERLGALKALLGAKGCAQLEKRMRQLYDGGPDSNLAEIAFQLWMRQPNPR